MATINTISVFLSICALLAVISLFDETEAAVAVMNTKFKEGGKFYCPKYSFISNFVIFKGEKQGNAYKDFRFYMECDLFPQDPDFDDKGPERCIVRFKWTMGGYDLKMDDHFKSCSCDEYLAGIKTEYKDGERIMQFRCCFARNKIHNITGCYFTGQRYLMADWNTEIRTKKGKPVTEGIQTFSIIDDYVIGRVCPYLVKGIDIESIDYMTNKCSGVKQRGIKDILDKIKSMMEECKIYMGSPFGWPQSQNSLSNDRNMDNDSRDGRLYESQKTMCKDGSYLYAIYKFPKVGDKGKDYVFLTRCHVLVYTVCYCFWRQNCTKPEKRNTSESNKTMYVAGWRSEWDEDNGRRKFEMWCCKSDGLKMSYCNLTKNFTDADTSLVIARPRYKFFAFYQPKCIDGQIIRDVDHWYKNGVLQLRFNICNINGSDGECEKPCKTCKDIDPTMQICRPPPVVPISISSTSSTSSTSGTTKTSTTSKSTTSKSTTTRSTTTPTTTTKPTTTTTRTTTTTTPTTTKCIEGPTGGICGPTTTTTTPTTTKPPPCKIDLNFMLDSSGSLTAQGFEQERAFLKAFVSQLDVDSGLNRVGLTEFGQSSQQIWTFTNTAQTQANLQKKIDDLKWWDSSTNITGAIQTALPVFASSSRHITETTCVPRVAILLTDGRHNTGDPPPSVPAEQMRAMGITVYAVGIGPDASKTQLTTITGDASKVFMVSFDDLQTIVDTVLKAACANQEQTCTDTIPPPKDKEHGDNRCIEHGEKDKGSGNGNGSGSGGNGCTDHLGTQKG